MMFSDYVGRQKEIIQSRVLRDMYRLAEHVHSAPDNEEKAVCGRCFSSDDYEAMSRIIMQEIVCMKGLNTKERESVLIRNQCTDLSKCGVKTVIYT